MAYLDVAVDQRLGLERVQVDERAAHGEDDMHPLLPAEWRLVHVEKPIVQGSFHALED